eukprot:GHVS01013574.1.p1 GENE.GHVS01013574.1~~GHVS01013574.1.p1  ORF type:complete len:741 (-),score=130.07 GHVS01013574.1:3509-5731(-)
MIHYDQDSWFGLRILCHLHGSVVPQSLPRALLSGSLCFACMHWQLVDTTQRGGGNLMWHPACFVFFLQIAAYTLAFHTNQAYNRYWEARTQVQQMASYWGDAVSQYMAFDEVCRLVPKQPLPSIDGPTWRARIIHLVSLLHAVCVQYLLHEGASGTQLEVLGGITQQEANLMSRTADRAFLVMHWISQHVSVRHMTGGLSIPAPILSRSWQVLSLGMLAYNQACKIEDTPFPFPYVQLLHLMDWLLLIVTPFVVASWMNGIVFAVILCMMVVGAFHAMFAAACKMETPFGKRSNDLPLLELHKDFVARLKSIVDISVAECLNDMIIHLQQDNNKPLASTTISQESNLIEREPPAGFAQMAKQYFSCKRFAGSKVGGGGVSLLTDSTTIPGELDIYNSGHNKDIGQQDPTMHETNSIGFWCSLFPRRRETPQQQLRSPGETTGNKLFDDEVSVPCKQHRRIPPHPMGGALTSPSRLCYTTSADDRGYPLDWPRPPPPPPQDISNTNIDQTIHPLSPPESPVPPRSSPATSPPLPPPTVPTMDQPLRRCIGEPLSTTSTKLGGTAIHGFSRGAGEVGRMMSNLSESSGLFLEYSRQHGGGGWSGANSGLVDGYSGGSGGDGVDSEHSYGGSERPVLRHQDSFPLSDVCNAVAYEGGGDFSIRQTRSQEALGGRIGPLLHPPKPTPIGLRIGEDETVIPTLVSCDELLPVTTARRISSVATSWTRPRQLRKLSKRSDTSKQPL